MAMEPQDLTQDVFGLHTESSMASLYPPYFLHSLFTSHHQSPMRHRRFVVTHSMIDKSRFNLALLVVFILSIILINAFVVAIIVLSKKLRSSSKHILILSVAVADLLQGLLILPIITDIGIKGSAERSCATFQVARLLADFLIPSITTLGVLALNVDYLLRLSCTIYSEGKSRVCILGALVLTPWVLSVVLLVPIYAVGVQRETAYDSLFNACRVIMEGHFARALLVLSYIFYGFLLLFFTLSVAILYLIKREYLGLDVTGERMHPPFDICLASFIVVLFYTPIFLFSLLTTEGYLGCREDEECRTLNWSYTLSLWLMFTKSWVLPMVWFFGKDTRAGIKQVLC